MKHLLMILSASILIVGCGSAVKLDNVVVEDKIGQTILQPEAGDSGNVKGRDSVKSLVPEQKTSPTAIPLGSNIIYFDYDSFLIKPEYQSIIETNARYIKADKSRKVVIEGHTDERGGREYNLALGQKRAEAMRSALSLLGVVDSQAEAVSFGKEKPAIQGSDENAMAKNRRAEINYR